MIKGCIYIVVGLFAIVTFSACEEIPIKLSDPVIPQTDRIVIIEDLAGASCPNCPKGNTAIENIIAKFPGRVAAVGIHGDFLSKPTSKSKYDFRNPKAKDLENWFKPWFGKPSASVNRVADENDLLMTPLPDLWQAAVEKELQKSHTLNIFSDTKYNSITGLVEIEVAAIPLTNLSGNFNISIYLTESSIIDAQTNGPVIVEDYKHNHVLRDMITKFDGDSFASDMKKSDIVKKAYAYTLSPAAKTLWNSKNMEVVISIHHNEPKNKSVVQAFYSKLEK